VNDEFVVDRVDVYVEERWETNVYAVSGMGEYSFPIFYCRSIRVVLSDLTLLELELVRQNGSVERQRFCGLPYQIYYSKKEAARSCSTCSFYSQHKESDGTLVRECHFDPEDQPGAYRERAAKRPEVEEGCPEWQGMNA